MPLHLMFEETQIIWLSYKELQYFVLISNEQCDESHCFAVKIMMPRSPISVQYQSFVNVYINLNPDIRSIRAIFTKKKCALGYSI